jgi:hypothetical protein
MFIFLVIWNFLLFHSQASANQYINRNAKRAVVLGKFRFCSEKCFVKFISFPIFLHPVMLTLRVYSYRFIGDFKFKPNAPRLQSQYIFLSFLK